MLPKIDVPIFNVKLLSNGKSLSFRPFTVKEEKLFLMANESEDLNGVVDTIKQVLNNCVLDEIDIESLPLFDIEHLFLNIRARSIGEVVNLKYKCNNTIASEEGTEEEKKCGNLVEIDLNILEIQPEKQEGHSTKVEITENMGIVMKYPNFETLKTFDIENEADSIIKTTIDCIDYIYDKDQVYYAKDNTQEELIEFVESMQAKDLEKIKFFFDTMPRMKKDIEFKCNKCGHEETIELEGIQNFFV
jgi:DNA-directed RNA polymerase subunit M/transcription elongation factor TFIIS